MELLLIVGVVALLFWLLRRHAVTTDAGALAGPVGWARGTDWHVVGPLARADSRRLLRHPAFIAGVVLTPLIILAATDERAHLVEDLHRDRTGPGAPGLAHDRRREPRDLATAPHRRRRALLDAPRPPAGPDDRGPHRRHRTGARRRGRCRRCRPRGGAHPRRPPRLAAMGRDRGRVAHRRRERVRRRRGGAVAPERGLRRARRRRHISAPGAIPRRGDVAVESERKRPRTLPRLPRRADGRARPVPRVPPVGMAPALPRRTRGRHGRRRARS